MLYLFPELELHINIMLIIALIFIFIYEIINGFHDTSNSVVTVIYTCALRSQLAVIMSGICNFLGVMLGGLSVAYTIIHLLPMQLLISANADHILAMVFSMIFAAVVWNLSTWYLRLPTSSSHTLIGALVGIGIVNIFTTHCSVAQGLNIQKLIEIFLLLIVSPFIGLLLARLMMLVFCRFSVDNIKCRCVHMTPDEQEKENGKRHPPFLLRLLLVLSSAGVSFSHGANDGQKGIGLVMLLLIGVIPTGFIMDMHATTYDIECTRNSIDNLCQYYIRYAPHHVVFSDELFKKNTSDKVFQLENTYGISDLTEDHLMKMRSKIFDKHLQILDGLYEVIMKDIYYDISLVLNMIHKTELLLNNLNSYDQLSFNQRSQLRYLLLCLADIADRVAGLSNISFMEKNHLKMIRKCLLHTIEYAPFWVIISIAISLSLGTIIGWRRVAITIGEKIGKKGMTYAQGLATQVTTAISIGLASYVGMPVSTTHVLSSAITGSMLLDGYGIQNTIVKNILISWVLTLPISTILSGLLYWLILKLFILY